jgi:calmodulin
MEEDLPNLSQLKRAEFKEAFDLFDRNRNGKISYVELGEIFRSVGQNPSEKELKEMIHEADGNEGGDLTYDRFILLMRKKMKDTDTVDELIEAFRLFDTEGKGLINILDLRQSLISMGEMLAPDEIDKIIQEADDDHDGYINYEEFVKKVMTDRDDDDI